MKFFEPNEKRNTIAVYVFLVAMFCVLCVIAGVNVSLLPKFGAFALSVLKPIIYGFVIAFTVHPLVRFTEKRILGNTKKKKAMVRHPLSVAIVYVVLITLIFLFCTNVIPEIARNYGMFKAKLESYFDGFQSKTAELLDTAGSSVYIYSDIDPQLRKDLCDDFLSFTIHSYNGIPRVAMPNSGALAVREAVNSILSPLLQTVTGALPSLFASVLTETKNLVIGIFISIYFLLGKDKHISRINYIAKVWLPEKVYRYTVWVVNKGKNIFRDYVVVRLLDGLVIGIIMFICLFMFGTPYAILLAVIMGICSFFPFIGPIIGICTGTLILFLLDIRFALLYLIISVLLNLLDTKYVEPFLNAGRQDRLPSFWVFTAIVVMGGFFGIVGVLIGIPVAAFIYAVLKALCERELRKKGLPDKTQAYLATTAEVEQANTPNIEAGTDMASYFADTRDDAQNFIVMKDDLMRKKSKILGLFKRKK